MYFENRILTPTCIVYADGNDDFVASKVTNDGNITYYKLDSSGKVMRDSNNIPVIYNINKE